MDEDEPATVATSKYWRETKEHNLTTNAGTSGDSNVPKMCQCREAQMWSVHDGKPEYLRQSHSESSVISILTATSITWAHRCCIQIPKLQNWLMYIGSWGRRTPCIIYHLDSRPLVTMRSHWQATQAGTGMLYGTTYIYNTSTGYLFMTAFASLHPSPNLFGSLSPSINVFDPLVHLHHVRATATGTWVLCYDDLYSAVSSLLDRTRRFTPKLS